MQEWEVVCISSVNKEGALKGETGTTQDPYRLGTPSRMAPSQFQEPEGGPEVWDPEEGPQWPRTKGSALWDTTGKEE